jgi:hypothetical protein
MENRCKLRAMKRAVTRIGLVASFAAANGCSSSSNVTYCSGSEGPVTASEAEQLKDGVACPPAGSSNGTCVEGGGTHIQGGSTWACVVQNNGEAGGGK